MRRTTTLRQENQIALALAEIERLKAISTRTTDGRVIVSVPGSTPGDGHTSDGNLVPIETSPHVLYGSKHKNSFLVTAAEGVSLTIFIQAGQVWTGGSFRSLVETTLQMADATTNYVYVSAAGAIASNAVSFPADGAPLATVVTVGGDITSVNDRRSYLSTGGAVVGSLHDADQLIDDDGDTSVEVERGADDDTIRLKAATVDVALITSAGQWQLPIQGSGAGILIGGDTQIYRAGADILYTPDGMRFGDGVVNVGIGGTAQITLDGNDGVINADTVGLMEFGGAIIMQARGNAYIVIDADDNATNSFFAVVTNAIVGGAPLALMELHDEGQLQLPIQGINAGILIGGDTQIYRAGADILRTPDTLIVDTALGIGVTAVPNNAVGWARLEIKGTVASSLGPHIQTKVSTDDWPVFQFFSFNHNNAAINFDAYWDGGWRSSYVNSNFQIYKLNDVLQFNYESGIAGGDTVTWLTGMALSITGQISLPTTGINAGLLLGGDALLYRDAADILATPDELLVADTLSLSALVPATVGSAIDNQKLLTFGIDRAWVFEAIGVGASSALGLRQLNDAKSFIIQSQDSTNAFRFLTANAAAGTLLEITGALNVSENILVDTINEFTAGVGTEIEGVIHRDGIIWGQTAHPEIGVSSPFNITFSGSEITDRTRALRIEGDGWVVPDSSVGVWEPATNLITNGGLETNTTGWVEQGSTTTRVTTENKFGAAAAQIVTDNAGANEGPYHAFAGAAVTVYSVSAWVRGFGGTVRIALWDDVAGKQASSPITLTPYWQRITHVATTGAASVSFRVYIETDVQQNITFNIDGAQSERVGLPTPYIETDGGTAARNFARPQVTVAGLLDETQGWVAFRVRSGWDAGDGTTAHPRFWVWRDDSNNNFLVWYRNQGDNRWAFQRENGGVSDTLWFSITPMTKDGEVTVIATWTATGVSLSIDGEPFETTAGSNIPTLAISTFDVGSRLGGQTSDSDFFWFACGLGTLTDLDARLIHAAGNTPPRKADLPSLAAPTLLWNCNTRAASPDLLLQDPAIFTVDYLTGDVFVGGFLTANGISSVGAISESVTGNVRADMGILSGSPRLILEHAGSSTIWEMDNETGALRWFNPGIVQMTLINSGQLALPRTGITTGLLLGTDALLYRDAPNMFRTPDSITVDVNLVTDNIIERTLDDGVEIDTAIIRDGKLWGEYVSPESGIGTHLSMILSGNEITDLVRALALSGDGLVAPDSSMGVWEATTNLITNGGFETNLTGWTVFQLTLTRETTEFLFGTASMKADTGANSVGDTGISADMVALDVPWQYSVYIREETGIEVTNSVATARFADRDANAVRDWTHIIDVGGGWYKCILTGLFGGAGLEFAAVRVVGVGRVVHLDGMQVEIQKVSTPYVETDGGTASRAAARIRADVSGLFTATQGWAAFRVRMGYANTDASAGEAILFNWADASNDLIELRYDLANNQWEVERANVGTGTVHVAADTFDVGQEITIIMTWTAAAIRLSVDGGAFTSSADTNIPTLAATTVDLGSDGSGSQFNGDIIWAVFGNNILTDNDVRLMNACRKTIPKRSSFTRVAGPTFLWDGNTGIVSSSPLIQDPDLIEIDYANRQIGFFGTTPISRPSAYTQTFATADKTHANPTASAPGDLVATNNGWGASTEANFDLIHTTLDALVADMADIKQLVNAVIDDLQAYGILQ